MIKATYAPDTDMTFILDENVTEKGGYTKVVGFYYGKPDEEATKMFKGLVEARYEFESEENKKA